MDEDLVNLKLDLSIPGTASENGRVALGLSAEDDDWGLSDACYRGNSRKRRNSDSPLLIGPEPSSSRKTLRLVRRHTGALSTSPHDEGSQLDNPRDLLRTLLTGSDGGKLQTLVASVMSEAQLRSLASLSSEWRTLAYQTIRRQKGDQLLIFLWAVEGRFSPPDICLQDHFHSSFIKPPRPGRQKGEEGQGQQDVAQSRTGIRRVQFSQEFHPDKRPRIKEIETIVSFGNESMTKQMEVFDNEEEMPKVKLYFHVCSDIILFSTPDMKTIGDSVRGIYGQTFPISSPCIGHFLASFAFPRSAAFELRSVTLTMRKGKYETGTGGLGNKNEDRSLVTKALVFFKIYDDSRVEDWMKNITESAANYAGKAVRVISGTFESVGSTAVRYGHSLHAAGLALVGNSLVSTFCIEFDMETFTQYLLTLKMNKVSQFIERENMLSKQRGEGGKDGYFAWIFWFAEQPVHSTVSTSYPATVVGIFKTFHQGFPTIPIQGIQSISYLNCLEVRTHGRDQGGASNDIDTEIDDDLSGQMQRLVTNPNYSKKDKVVLLLVKYSII